MSSISLVQKSIDAVSATAKKPTVKE